MQLLYAPLLVSTTNDVNKVQRGRAGNEGIFQSLQGICEKDRFVVILAGERMGAHQRPVDIRRYYLSEESCGVDLAWIVEDLCDLTFVWIFGGGYTLICRAVLC